MKENRLLKISVLLSILFICQTNAMEISSFAGNRSTKDYERIIGRLEEENLKLQSQNLDLCSELAFANSELRGIKKQLSDAQKIPSFKDICKQFKSISYNNDQRVSVEAVSFLHAVANVGDGMEKLNWEKIDLEPVDEFLSTRKIAYVQQDFFAKQSISSVEDDYFLIPKMPVYVGVLTIAGLVAFHRTSMPKTKLALGLGLALFLGSVK